MHNLPVGIFICIGISMVGPVVPLKGVSVLSDNAYNAAFTLPTI